MKKPAIIAIVVFVALLIASSIFNFDLLLQIAATILDFDLVGMLVFLVLIVGAIAEPFRVFQAATGRLYTKANASEDKLRKAADLFYCALPFWLALLWAIWNIGIIKSCSGDNCISYSLLAIPFPFIYGVGELFLFEAASK